MTVQVPRMPGRKRPMQTGVSVCYSTFSINYQLIKFTQTNEPNCQKTLLCMFACLFVCLFDNVAVPYGRLHRFSNLILD